VRIARDAEVQEQRSVVRRDADVARLHVAVDDAVLVRALQRASEVARPSQRAFDADRAPLRHRVGEHLVQRAARHELHRDEADASLLADRVDADDVRMAEPSERERLAPQPRLGRRRVAQLRTQHLERDLAPQRLLLGQVDGAHAALVETAHDAEVAEPLGRALDESRRLARRPAALGDVVDGLQPRADLGRQRGEARAELVEVARLAPQPRVEVRVEDVVGRRVGRVAIPPRAARRRPVHGRDAAIPRGCGARSKGQAEAGSVDD
jgi:hypothetical protein